MIRQGLLLTCVVGVLISASLSQDKPVGPSRYTELAERLKKGDRNVDFRELRIAYAGSTGGGYTDAQKKAMTAALSAKKYEAVLKNADVVLDNDYVDMDAHFAEYIADRELHHTEQAEFHKYVLQGLLDSITHSGDGKSFETAYEVIEVHEEYVILRFMGLMPSEQSVSEKNGHSYDILKTVNPKTKEKVTLYFNIDIEEKHLKDALK